MDQQFPTLLFFRSAHLLGQRLQGLYPDIPAFYLDERHCDLTRNYVVKNNAILLRQKQYKIIAPKTTESYGAKNYTNGFRCCDLTKKFGAKIILSFS